MVQTQTEPGQGEVLQKEAQGAFADELGGP